ncbi:zinc finger protein 862-like [Mya arenaria]|uniref:zinc finger protein 862-like n=1 Tax=Mya arenaria TaxID=6604 RepID=UPI0022E2A064|nr:zinc finger protein 862-like [Mya arenaria]
MTCKVCQEYMTITQLQVKVGKKFLTGCSNLKISAINDHEMSDMHKKAVESEKNTSTVDVLTSSSSGKALLSLKQAERNKLQHLFRNAHAVAKRGRPLRDYKWLCECTEAHGVKLGDTYKNSQAALAFLTYIGTVEVQQTIATVRMSKSFSILLDGSTDLSGDEQESIYIRCSTNGKITERFCSLRTPESTRSKDIHSMVNSFMEEHSLEKSKHIGLGSDGASNMTGVKAGLAALLKNGPHFINVHCLVHRLELAFRDALKGVKFYDKLMTLLIGLHYHYKKYYKNKKGRKDTFEALQLKAMLPPKVTGTRWLPHLSRGLKALIKGYRAFECHLSDQSHNNPKAEGLVKIMTDKHVVAFFLFLHDFIEPLAKLSAKMQQKSITLGDAMVWIEATKETIAENALLFWR